MLLKELIRVVINSEMEAVSVYEAEAELFGPAHEKGPEIKALYMRLAMDKRTRLKRLGGIFKHGAGFRKRETETSRSVEASLRAHAARATRGVTLYSDLYKQLGKPEFKEAIAEMLAGERACLEAVREMQSRIKK